MNDPKLKFAAMVFAFALAQVAFGATTQVLPLSGMGLDGELPVFWEFKLDAGRGSEKWTRIAVPSCWEQAGFGAYYYGGQGRHKPDDDPIIPKETGTYRRTFELPASWSGQSVHIVFEAAMTDTTVAINGVTAGATHQGGFYRFEYDITKLVRPGRNTIEVQVSKESSNKSVNFAERRGDYWTFGGIYRPVWLEARPLDHIDWTAIDARADGSFYAQAHLSDPQGPGARVQAHINDASGKVVGTFEAKLIHERTAVITGKVESPALWTAETPNLYSATFVLTNVAAVSHEVKQRFGFRTLEVRPRDGVYLNGRKIVLKGINRHSFRANTGRTLTRAENFEDARLIKGANMNAVRMSHYPPDPAFLDAADELGLYVLNELAGWQGFYDTPTGARLIGQIVRRDVNHPSILFWDNGNEGGWNRENDGVFDLWDPQRRPVLHPWGIHSGINTDHYENYESTRRLSAGPDIFMPTEFLHGLYDGGIGAGFRDYWDVMGASPTVAGGFFWVFADEGIARTDLGGTIDNKGNLAPDGIVGARHEKEGSYFTVKKIWSPVQIEGLTLDRGVLRMKIENRYDFNNLNSGSVNWRILRLPPAGSAAVSVTLLEGNARGPDLSPRNTRDWQIPLDSAPLKSDEVLEFAFRDMNGTEVWTWALKGPPQDFVDDESAMTRILARGATVSAGRYELKFDPESGEAISIRQDGRGIEIRGPALTAWHRGPKQRDFTKVAESSVLRKLELAPPDSVGVIARARYEGPLDEVVWRLKGQDLSMSYSLRYSGPVDILGVKFDFPKSRVTAKRWVGEGPYRIWKNREEGTRFGLHSAQYSLSVPGQTYRYPEFEGFFGAWNWLEMQTKNADVTFRNIGQIPYLGLYQPALGENPIIDLPESGWSLLHAIPPIGTKFDVPGVLGPQSQLTRIEGELRGEVLIGISRRD